MGRGRQTAPYDVPQCMVFRPSMEEIQNFQGYMEYMEENGAHLAGIAKIILPEEWVPRKVGYALDSLKDVVIKRPIKQTFTIVGDDKRAYQTKSSSRGPMTVQEYYEMSQNHTYRTPPHKSHDDLERKYWKSLSFVPPIYGADIADSITDPDCKHFNMAKLQSILNYVNQDQNESYAGVTTPYLYMGSWKTTFSWHVEDMDLYAINYLHFGMPKTWYCVPPKYGHLLEKACRTLFPNVANWCSNFMRHKTCLVNPSLLDELGVPYQKVVQEERNAIIVYPYAYHSGFNHGFNCAESTNFALERWVEYGKRYRPCDCSSNNVKINMDCFVRRFQPDIYEKWVAGKDIGPHPEDPPDVVALIKLKVDNPEAYAAIMAEKIQKESEKSSERLMFYTSTGRNLAVFKNTLRFVKGDNITLSNTEKNEYELWKQEQRNNSKIIFQEAGGPIVSADRRLVHIYQHVELTQLKIKVLPRTLTVIGDGLSLLERSMPNERFQSVKELIERGTLVKIGERQMKRKRNFVKKTSDTQETHGNEGSSATQGKRQLMEKIVYELEHKYMDLKAFVFSDNLNKYYGHQTDALTTYMDGSNMNILVQNGTFKKINEFKVFVEGEEEVEDKCKATCTNVEEEYEFFSVYYNYLSEKCVVINPVTLATPNIQQETLDLSCGQNINDLIASKKLKLIQERKKFKKGTEYKCRMTPVKIYYHPKVKMNFYMTKSTPPKLYLTGRPKKEIVEDLNSRNFDELEANGTVIYREDHVLLKFVPTVNYRRRGKKQKQEEDTVTINKYYFSANSLVEVDVARTKNGILYRLPMGNGKEDLVDVLINWKIEDLLIGGVLKEIFNVSSSQEDVSRLQRIVKCKIVPKNVYKFDIRGYPNRHIYSNDVQTEIVGRLPDELKAMERSSVKAMIKDEIIFNGQMESCYTGEISLKKAIMNVNLTEIDSRDYELTHPSTDVHLVKNYKNNELFIIKKTDPPISVSETSSSNQEPMMPIPKDINDVKPCTSSVVSDEELIIKEDEEVDEDDYDDIEDSEEDDIILQENEELSDDERGRAISDDEEYSPDDPDFKVTGPQRTKPMPSQRRRKRSRTKAKQLKRTPRGRGKQSKNEEDQEKSIFSIKESYNLQGILKGTNNQEMTEFDKNEVSRILESFGCIIKEDNDRYVWAEKELRERIRQALENSSSLLELKASLNEITNCKTRANE